MCFRPAEADTKAPVLCRECGKRINPVQDVYPEKCPFCKCDNPAEGAEPAFSPNPPRHTSPGGASRPEGSGSGGAFRPGGAKCDGRIAPAGNETRASTPKFGVQHRSETTQKKREEGYGGVHS